MVSEENRKHYSKKYEIYQVHVKVETVFVRRAFKKNIPHRVAECTENYKRKTDHVSPYLKLELYFYRNRRNYSSLSNVCRL
jgi:hypothetical protein